MNKIIIPSGDILKPFENIMFSINQLTNKNNEHSYSITSLRDKLLPKLISGELKIPNKESASEAVA
jgi:type I restriction enzyme S subunit